jgi:DNA-binding transcriptional regulator YhcF (GntR family)
MIKFKFIEDNTLTKVQQVAEAIIRSIDKGEFQKNDRLPSINQFNTIYKVARDTIEKAYGILRKREYIISIKGKGYFVVGKKETGIRVLLIFNKLSSFKKIVYDSFLQTLGKKAKVDLQIYHYDPLMLKEIIQNNLGKYHYYAVMPHFFLKANLDECKKILELIPESELLILDKRLPGLKSNCIEVYQDFRQDIYYALSSANNLLNKYDKMNLLLDESDNHPQEIIIGATQYCIEHNKSIRIASRADSIKLQKKTVYIVTTDDDLAVLVKQVRMSDFCLGKDIGIISFNETVLKELLDITVITTDFKLMGKAAAECILKKEVKKINNPFYMIKRGSL